MVDQYKGVDTPMTSARNFYDVVPDDNDDLPHIPKGIVANADGAVTMVGHNGVTVTVNLIANVIYAYAPKIIKDTGTDAIGIVALH